MKRNTWIFAFAALVLVAVAGAVIFFFISQLKRDEQPPVNAEGYQIGFGADTARARVVEIIDEGTITLGDHTQLFQVMQVSLMEGPWVGEIVEIDYGRRQIRPPGLNLTPGDQVLVTVSQLSDGSLAAYFTDFIRTKPLIWLAGTFVLFSILVSGWKGLRSLIGMGISLAIIILYIIPQILEGKDPVMISISGAFLLLAITLYLTYGWTLKTHAAVIGVLISLVLTGFLARHFVLLTRLTGFGSEDALFLIQQSQVQINLRGLVLGGMLIGALGVLDDLVITQSSAAFELFASHPSQTLNNLYRSTMRIGQDHVAATVNTLVLAYAGAALPTLLLFSLSGERYAYLVNLEFVAEEIVRTLVGSLGLIAAVPITSVLASALAVHHRRLGSLRRFLGPLNTGGSASHSQQH